MQTKLHNLNISKFVDEKKLKFFFNKLYPICRSITGKGFVKSLKILNEIEKINFIKVKTGTKVLDWVVPKEWNIEDGYILYKNKKIVDFKKHSLHVLNYSDKVDKFCNYKELNKHLYTLPKSPNAIPYVHSYYDRKWGFALKHNQFKKLNKNGNYRVVIKSSFKNGNLTYSNNLIKGKTKKEILFYTYLCHPQMANHELGGPLLWTYLYKILKKTGPHKYSYRFVCCPENIGAAAFLAQNRKILKNIEAGYIINCVGNGKIVTYKKSRDGNTLADQAALNVINFLKYKKKIVDFFPDGSDERQFCSPGFNLPIGLVMRKMFGEFKEYHTSLDNPNFINFKTILESLDIYLQIVLTLENNFYPIGRVQYGTPQLARVKNFNLYPNMMNFQAIKRSDKNFLTLQILNLACGKKSLLKICNEKNYKLIDYLDVFEELLRTKLIKIK